MLDSFSAHRAIEAIMKLPADKRTVPAMELLRKLTTSKGGFLVEWNERQIPSIALQTGEHSLPVREKVLEIARRVEQSKQARTDRFNLNGQIFQLFTVPILKDQKIEKCVTLATPPTRQQKSPDVMGCLQWFALLFYGIAAENEQQRQQRAVLKLAGLVESMEYAALADDFSEATSRLVDSFRVQSGCDRVALATIRFGRVKLREISGLDSSAETRSEGASAMTALLQAACSRDKEVEGGTDCPNKLQPEIGALGVEKFWCTPLRHGDKTVGAWLFLWNQTPGDYQEQVRFLRSASGQVGSQLKLMERTKPGRLGGRLRRLWKRTGAKGKGLVFSLGAGLVFLALVPLPFQIKAPGVVQPHERQIVSAPFDGVLRQAKVEPGERVQSGQLLAELDGREIRWKLAETRAQKLRAEKQADAAMSEGRIADAQVARLEANSLQESTRVLEFRQQNLQIKSPRDGRVLRGDLKRSEGATLKMGETLFEIGHLGTMSIEIEVREADIALVQTGAPVKLRFDSLPGETREAKLKTVSPGSEFRNGSNVFVCRATIECSDEELRPGGLARAWIDGPPRPLIWRMLRTPCHWILQRLP